MHYNTSGRGVWAKSGNIQTKKPKSCSWQDWAPGNEDTTFFFVLKFEMLHRGLTALRFLRQSGVKSGDRVMIYGASGSVGTFAVQIAKSMGAEVTAVCSKANANLAAQLGARKIIDYTKEDFTKTEVRYDHIFDAVGKTSKSAASIY